MPKIRSLKNFDLRNKMRSPGFEPSNVELTFIQGITDDFSSYDCLFTEVQFNDKELVVNDRVRTIIDNDEHQAPLLDDFENGLFVDRRSNPTIVYIDTSLPLTDEMNSVSEALSRSLLIVTTELLRSNLLIPIIGIDKPLFLPIELVLLEILKLLSDLDKSSRTMRGAINAMPKINVELAFHPPVSSKLFEEMIHFSADFVQDSGTLDTLRAVNYDKPKTPQERALKTSSNLLGDGRAEEDLLGHKRIAAALAAFLRAGPEEGNPTSGTALPITIAIDGSWGTGKSSMMGFLQKELQDPKTSQASSAETSPQGPFRALGQLISFWLEERLSPIARLTLQPWTKRRDRDSEKKKAGRTFETVWINAWRHGTGERLKARLVHLIVQDLTMRRGSPFLYKLNLARFNKMQLFRTVTQGVFSSFFSLVLIGVSSLILIIFSVEGYDDANPLSAFRTGIPGGVLFLWASSLLNKHLKSPPEIAFKDHFLQPNYEGLVGADMEIESDFERILSVLKSEGKTLALFIDDLDRCSPKQVAEVIETLNVFLGKEDHQCVFILGMHFDMVAAALDVAYEEVRGAVDSQPALAAQRPFGRRFLEKIVQFTVSVPHASKDDTDRYVRYLATGSTSEEQQDMVQEALEFYGGLGERNKSSSDMSAEWEQFRSNFAEQLENGEGLLNVIDKEIVFQERIEKAGLLDETDPVVLLIFNSLRFVLRDNPRQYKRFFNRMRFRNYIDQALVSAENGSYQEQLLDTAKAVVLELEFPIVARWLSERGIPVRTLREIVLSVRNGEDKYGLTNSSANTIEHEILKMVKAGSPLVSLSYMTWETIQKEGAQA